MGTITPRGAGAAARRRDEGRAGRGERGAGLADDLDVEPAVALGVARRAARGGEATVVP